MTGLSRIGLRWWSFASLIGVSMLVTTMYTHAELPTGAPPATQPAHSAVKVEAIDLSDAGGGFRISNGTTTALVIKRAGRVLEYGTADGNLLLSNARRASTQPADKWPNFGGDKTWIWPQNKWYPNNGGWPPGEFDTADYSLMRVGDGVIATSGPIDSYGLRVIRQIRLAPTGTELTVHSKLEPLRDRKLEYVPWHVTQVRYPSLVLARLVPTDKADEPAYAPMGTEWAGVERIGDDIVAMPTDSNENRKLGLNADVLAALVGDTLVVQRALVPPGGRFAPAERAQVWRGPTGYESDPYVELEFIAPWDAPPQLTVVWSIHKQESPPTTTEGWAKALRAALKR